MSRFFLYLTILVRVELVSYIWTEIMPFPVPPLPGSATSRFRHSLDVIESSRYFRRITARNARGQVTEEKLGNGLITQNYQHYPATGQMSSMYMDTGLVLMDYEYDLFGNLSRQIDWAGEFQESYAYDRLSRLTQAARGPIGGTATNTIDYGYDAIGRFFEKTDFSRGGETIDPAYRYGANGANCPADANMAGPHAVTEVDLSNGNTAGYGYDANGNLTCGDFVAGDLAIKYDAFNRTREIERNGQLREFDYSAGNSRFIQIDNQQLRTEYIGKHFERVGGQVSRHYIGDYAMFVQGESAATDGVRYLHRDRLGSVKAISQGGVGIGDASRAFGPFGAPREMDGGASSDGLNREDLSSRGFTGHDHLSSVGLIHMNGRVFDPGLGRFMSVDPIVQFPGFSQGWNPYSYINNNPFSGTDPSGFSALCTRFGTGEMTGGCSSGGRVSLRWNLGAMMPWDLTRVFAILSIPASEISLGQQPQERSFRAALTKSEQEFQASVRTYAIAAENSYEDATAIFTPGLRRIRGDERSKLLPGLEWRSSDTGFSAEIFEVLDSSNSSTGQFIIGFAGTKEPLGKDAGANAAQAIGLESGQYEAARLIANAANEKYGERLSFVGHSLGGGLASLAALETGRRAITFNSAGLHSRYKAFRKPGVVGSELIDAYYVVGEAVSLGQDLSAAPSAVGRRIAIYPSFWEYLSPISSYRLHPMAAVYEALAEEGIQ